MQDHKGLIISIVSHKGGTAKTSVCASLSHSLANKGYKVLAIDMDPQSDLSKLLVATRYGGSIENIPRTLYDALKKESPLPIQEVVHGTPFENLFCIPNSTASNILEIDLYGNVSESFVYLRTHLRDWAKENYDFIIIDNAPTLSLWVHMSLYASDFAIIPVEAGSQFSLEGIKPALQLIASLQKHGNPDLAFLRLLVNKVDLRTSKSKSAVSEICERFGREMVFDTTIPYSAEFHKAEENHTTVLRQAPRSSASQKYRTLAQEICTLVEIPVPVKDKTD